MRWADSRRFGPRESKNKVARRLSAEMSQERCMSFVPAQPLDNRTSQDPLLLSENIIHFAYLQYFDTPPLLIKQS